MFQQQQSGHIVWPIAEHCDDCGQPTTILPHDTYALCTNCQPTTTEYAHTGDAA